MRRSASRATVAVAACICITIAVATPAGAAPFALDAGANYNFRVFPRVGNPTTTFRITFNAPFAADGVDTDYTLEGVGPRRCPDLFEFTTGRIRRGDRVAMELTPSNDILLTNRRRWCPGSYFGYVYYTTPGFRPNKFIGYFSFGVGRKPVSLEG